MKKNRLLFFGLTIGIFLVFGFLMLGSIQNTLAESSTTNSSNAGITETPSFAIGSDEILPPDLGEGVVSLSVLPTPIPGETLVYFATTDSDATATVMYLLNTDSVAHTVALRGYNYSGMLGYSLYINIAASSLVRLSSDSIAASPPPSWSTPAPIITNFTDFTYF